VDFKHAKRNKKLDSLLTVILLTSFLLCLNFILSKINYSIDLTDDSKYTLSPETISKLNKITKPIDIIITIPDNNKQPKIIQKLLHDLTLILQSFQNLRLKNKIRVHRINLDSALSSSALINKYKLTERNQIIAVTPSGKKRLIFKYEGAEGSNVLDKNNLFRSQDSLARETVWSSGFYGKWKEGSKGIMVPTEFRGEEVILQSIIEVGTINDKKRVAYFTRGHGEGSPSDINQLKGFSELRTLLEDQNIKVSTIDLSIIEKVPSDAKLIIITAPKGTFRDQEISIIRNFVNHDGGKLLVAFDPIEEISNIDRPAFGLREILLEWGIRCHDMLIFDPQKQNFDIFTGDYSLRTYSKGQPHKIINKLREGRFSIQTSRVRPVETIKLKTPNIETTEILFSSRDSWGVSSWVNRQFPPERNELLDMQGPVPVVAISEIKNIGLETKSSTKGKLIVIGSSSIFTNKRLKENSGNRYLVKNIIYWLLDDDDMLEIESKKINVYTLSLTSNELSELLYLLSVIPIMVALIGIFVGWLRKEL
jgi:ABC-type uncharacterized transport system involved in gliding motility auxiliary subunit